TITPGTYLLFGENNQQLTGAVSATISGVSTQVVGPDDDASAVVNANSALATANGNLASNLAADELNQNENWGLRILSSQIASSPATVVSEITNTIIGEFIIGLEDGNLTANENTIAAATAVNNVSNTLEGMP